VCEPPALTPPALPELTPEEIKRVLHPLPRRTHRHFLLLSRTLFPDGAPPSTYDFNKMFRLRIANPQAKLRRSLHAIVDVCPVRGMEWTKDMLEQFFVKRTKGRRGK